MGGWPGAQAEQAWPLSPPRALTQGQNLTQDRTTPNTGLPVQLLHPRHTELRRPLPSTSPLQLTLCAARGRGHRCRWLRGRPAGRPRPGWQRSRCGTGGTPCAGRSKQGLVSVGWRANGGSCAVQSSIYRSVWGRPEWRTRTRHTVACSTHPIGASGYGTGPRLSPVAGGLAVAQDASGAHGAGQRLGELADAVCSLG